MRPSPCRVMSSYQKQFIFSLGTYRVSAVGVKDQQFESRLKLHPNWLALRDDELSKVSGIPDCVFVHAAGFIGGNKTRDGALAMAVKTLEHAGKIN